MPFEEFVSFPPDESCRSNEHNPPRMIVLEPGIHTWRCPQCGQAQQVVVKRPVFG